MAINLRNYRNSIIQYKSVTDMILERETKEKKKNQKWWNRIIPKLEEGQIIPNGISYKRWRNNFKLMLRIYKLRINLSYNYYPSVDDYWELENRIKKPSFGFGFSCQYN